MGQGQSENRIGGFFSKGSRDALDNSHQYGTVTVRVTWLGNNRRNQDRQNTHVVTARGNLFHGSTYSPSHIAQGT